MCQCDGTPREEKFDSRYHPDGTGRRGRPKQKSVVVPVPAPAPALTMIEGRTSAKKARKRIRGNVQQSKAVGDSSGDDRLDPDNDSGVSGSSADECPKRVGKMQGELSSAHQLALAVGKKRAHCKIVTGDFATSSASLDEKARMFGIISSAVSKACLLLAPDDAEGLSSAFFANRAPVPASETNLLRTASDMQAALPPRCDQRRVLVAALCASQTKAAAS